jgi:hypothetical protein
MTATTFGVLKADLKTAGMVRPEDRKHDDETTTRSTAPRRGDLLVTNGPDAAAACGQLIVAVDEKNAAGQAAPGDAGDPRRGVFNAKTRRTGDALTWVAVGPDERRSRSARSARCPAPGTRTCPGWACWSRRSPRRHPRCWMTTVRVVRSRVAV